ncbi:MAG: Fe-S protein assembly co-chaperone HscB, partial [Bacteroidota bacterium]
MNYFEFYDLPVSFHPDDDALRQQYYRKSRQYHPDFHTLSTVEHQEEMQDLSTLNNEAYKTLSDPDRRMRYILELHGLLGEADQSAQLPQAFLLE